MQIAKKIRKSFQQITIIIQINYEPENSAFPNGLAKSLKVANSDWIQPNDSE